MHPNFEVLVYIFCDTYEKTRIAKAGNFELPVGISCELENIATGNERSGATPVDVSATSET